MPEAMNECDLRAYLSKFGLITEVFGPKDKMGSASVRRGFVTFLETDSVRRVLAVQPHLLCDQHVVVRLARRTQDNDILVTDRADDDLSQSDEDNDSTLASYDPTIFIGHLKKEITTPHLEAYFSQFGRVSKAVVVRDWATGISRGYGFVTFADCRAFNRGVLKACHFLHGCRLSVQLSVNRVPSRVDPGQTSFQLKCCFFDSFLIFRSAFFRAYHGCFSIKSQAFDQ
ncbi:unnamed protein product [Dibothriocephalus latus]|uniref:RRM domain-containing protein n=1 Tax=Dibothriocephalus latus TaxID=60516 RepID=A0A3P6QY77_DIBLA|nr:unnamed protein product [Dibothriocephalus latus]